MRVELVSKPVRRPIAPERTRCSLSLGKAPRLGARRSSNDYQSFLVAPDPPRVPARVLPIAQSRNAGTTRTLAPAASQTRARARGRVFPRYANSAFSAESVSRAELVLEPVPYAVTPQQVLKPVRHVATPQLVLEPVTPSYGRELIQDQLIRLRRWSQRHRALYTGLLGCEGGAPCPSECDHLSTLPCLPCSAEF